MSREPYRWSKCSKQTYSLQTSLRVCGLGPPLSLVASKFLLPLNAAVADAENNRVWTKQDYKDKLFDPLVEKLLNELNHRFSDESNSILTSMSSLFPSSDNFLDRDHWFHPRTSTASRAALEPRSRCSRLSCRSRA